MGEGFSDFGFLMGEYKTEGNFQRERTKWYRCKEVIIN